MNPEPPSTCNECGSDLTRGTTSLHLERGTIAITIGQVPASICERCGASFIAGETAKALSRTASRATMTFERILGLSRDRTRAGKSTTLKPVQVAFEEEPEGGYHVWAPLLQGCHSSGRTKEEARKNSAEAIALWTESAQEIGISIPETELIAPLT